MPIVVEDGPGFLVNRLLFPYVSEALELLLEGVPPDAIEHAAARFGMDMGPLHLLDEIGLDTALRAGMNLSGAFVERVSASPLLVKMVKAGRLGRKSGAGFFDYPQSAHLAGPGARPSAPRLPSTAEVLMEFATTSLADAPRRIPQVPPVHAISARLVLAMLIEAVRLWEERKVCQAGDIDLGAVFGLGFPESRGGLLWWADTLGAARLLALLQPLARLGQRWQPPPLLVEMGRRRQPFHVSSHSS
jgi:3-hydroxyacyl-CoA dehydrogenase/enoyl-CoA hydratase/3-hydroxybutyryl-CoA epimerase/3-hydroxyacyl-CoA dehydrogenase/enoyl-CoA hydratase/3-hydroxybutyryl-CoA epimerase/enoyl-CoA isomerase